MEPVIAAGTTTELIFTLNTNSSYFAMNLTVVGSRYVNIGMATMPLIFVALRFGL
jgi:hypothetical protein